MKTFEARIEGISSLLQHAFGTGTELDSSKKTRKVEIEERTPREEAENYVYRARDKTIFVPGAAIARLLREAGGSHKQTGSRKSLKWIVPAGCIVTNDELTLLSKKDKPLRTFEVDSRPVVIPATKGRIMRHRPRFDEWRLNVSLEIDEDVISAKIVHQLLEEGARRLGIGDFRPEKGGSFGRFAVISWKELR